MDDTLPIRNKRGLSLELELSKLMPVFWAKTITELPDCSLRTMCLRKNHAWLRLLKKQVLPPTEPITTFWLSSYGMQFMKAVWFRIVIFFPSSLEMGKEGDSVFLVDQKAQPSRYKGSTVSDWEMARSGVGEGKREQEADTAGLGQLGWVCVKAWRSVYISAWSRNDRVALQC